jgi:mannose-6-phosphate isomerase-like protein (cupin superfamily)
LYFYENDKPKSDRLIRVGFFLVVLHHIDVDETFIFINGQAGKVYTREWEVEVEVL